METSKIKVENKEITNYQVVYSINQKIIYEYLLSIGLSTNELNITDINLISYLVCLSTNEQSSYKIIDDEKYFFVMNNFIKTNLIFLKIGNRQIGNIIEKLEKINLIKRVIQNENERLIKVNDFLLYGF